MSVERAFSEDLARARETGELRLEGPEAHHLSRVRRGRAGDRVLVFDGAGDACWARVREVSKRDVTLDLDPGEPVPDTRPVVPVWLAVAPPKGKRMAWLLEKATELAASGLVPLRTARGVVDPSVRRDPKEGKWRRATIEAAKQCGALVLPSLAGPEDLAGALAREASVRLLLSPAADARPLAGALPDDLSAGVLALIGPEGGFTDEEEGAALAAGAVPIRLAPTVLRVETAAIALLAAVRALRG